MDWDAPEVTASITAALNEDIGSGDRTAERIVPAGTRATARLVARQTLVLAGMPLFERVLRTLSREINVERLFSDGQEVRREAVVARLNGPARAILAGERTAINFLAHLCGIATLTRRFSEAIAGTNAFIRDTRKTTPMLRALEKYAVRAGGGRNHRFGLFDAILIKENHIAIAGGVAEALRRARAATPTGAGEGREMTAYESFHPPGHPPGEAERTRKLPIQIEVRNEGELREALAAGAESVLLDNTPPVEAARLMGIARAEKPGCVIEISGGVNLSNVRAYAEAGADYISVGAITHSAPAADLSLLVELSAVK